MKSRFELFVAGRYLRARRKEAVIPVITAISVLGVAAGVMALVIALAVNNGFKNTLERNLLGAMAHINVMEKEPLYGIENWRDMAARLRKLPHVTDVAPAIYTPALLVGGLQPKYVVLKGVDVDTEVAMTDSLRHLKAGSLDRLRDPNANPPGIVLGSGIVEDTAMRTNSRIDGVFQGAELTPMGPTMSRRAFRVSGVFESGFFEIDDNWAGANRERIVARWIAEVLNS